MEKSAFSVQENLPMTSEDHYTPWGKQGVTLKEAPNSENAIQQANLDWDVELRPVLFNTNPPSRNQISEFTRKKVVVRKSDNRPLSVVGNKWKPLQNTEAFQFFDPYVEQGLCEYSTAGYVNNGEKVWIMAKILADPFEVLPNDNVDSYILLTNVHSGTSCGRVLFTNVRLVCTNMLASIQQHSKQKSKIFHMGDVRQSVADVQEIIDIRARDFQTTLENYRTLSKTPVSKAGLDNYLNQVLSNTRTKMVAGEVKEEEDDKSYKNTKLRIEELFETGIGTDIKGVSGTWWGAYNAITEYFGYHKGRIANNRLDSVLYGDSRKKTQKAFDIALKLAA